MSKTKVKPNDSLLVVQFRNGQPDPETMRMIYKSIDEFVKPLNYLGVMLFFDSGTKDTTTKFLVLNKDSIKTAKLSKSCKEHINNKYFNTVTTNEGK
jgi:hypothetical protein